MKKRSVILIVGMLVLVMPIIAQDQMVVNIDSVTVRGGPSADSNAVGQLKMDTPVQILNSSGQWWRIKSGNLEGYVNSMFLSNEVITVKAPDDHRCRSCGTTRCTKFQAEYDEAVRIHDQRARVLPPGLVLPGGETVQE